MRNQSKCHSLKIKKGRLNQTIIDTGERFGGVERWGNKPHEFGMRRLAGTSADGAMRNWFVRECRSLGCDIKVDQIGNIFAIFRGREKGKPTAIGSHLDTQPQAGKYDGILGVLAGLEVLRTFKENDFVPHYDVCVIVWFNEEGARFTRYCMGSSVWAGTLDLEEAYGMLSVTDVKRESVRDSLLNIGYLGDAPASYLENGIDAHYELHIEQGPVLEDEEKKIGVVTGVQACYWEKFTVFGIGAHAGTTPWRLRKDALNVALRMIIKAEEVARKFGGLFTCGMIDVRPYSANIIPSEASFTLDYRHDFDETLFKMLEEAKASFSQLVESEEMSYKSERLAYTPVVNFNPACVKCVSKSALSLFREIAVKNMQSGAGHDSCQVSTRVPTSMIFVPSKDGLSHNYREHTSPEDVESGLEVLLGAVINHDTLRAERL
ncbi:M20 family metallo-hydrolase [Lachancea thermotolerans CBS 6340]|uniref:KLTH0E03344p n=1 Tax=Lachancea thermotolerans (strain ATCC 56472 / CBS 6340 / NRRL Y-8284) TaxID=559295 RepID=C5DHD0_LACTC|nr:KLTH0E03344p [Lachancea thermotolerans CBS 6340]CAR23191.1 KLTH0E03344p [Lachancea thermotolerans CBS 6340]